MSIPIARLDFAPRQACSSRKIGYESEGEVRVFLSRGRTANGPASYYPCHECRLYHVTTTMVGGERKRRATKGAAYRKARAISV